MTTEADAVPITGQSLPSGQFRLHQTDVVVDVDAVFAVLRGELAAYRITNFISRRDCERIEARFWESTRRGMRYGEGADGVEAYILGASHIDKSTDEYLSEAAACADAVADLYAGGVDPIAAFRRQVAAHDRAPVFRVASHDGRSAGDSKAVCWNNTGDYLLLPHEDLAQLSDPLQAGFEIQTIRQVMAINAYPRTSGSAGRLQLWNLKPDNASRARLGLSTSGYPYPPEVLTGLEHIAVPVAMGDLCVINGNLVHAVLGGQAAPGTARRLLLTCFSGQTSSGDVVWWT